MRMWLMKDQQAMQRLNSLMMLQKFCADKGRNFQQDLTVYILILARNHIVKLWWIKVKARKMADL